MVFWKGTFWNTNFLHLMFPRTLLFELLNSKCTIMKAYTYLRFISMYVCDVRIYERGFLLPVFLLLFQAIVPRIQSVFNISRYVWFKRKHQVMCTVFLVHVPRSSVYAVFSEIESGKIYTIKVFLGHIKYMNARISQNFIKLVHHVLFIIRIVVKDENTYLYSRRPP